MRNDSRVLVEKAIVAKVFPGCVVGVVRKDGERGVFPFGHFTYNADAPAVREDTVYDLASITKSIPTASLASMLIDEGKLRSADRVKEYLPELRNDYGATVENLLTYRVQGPQLSVLKDKTAEDILEYVFEHGFSGPPAESVYTNLPALLLGLIIERVGGDTLDHLAQKYFFDPLEMSHTTFFPNGGVYETTNIAPTEIDDRGVVCGSPHDESAYMFAKAGRAVGHAGLFSTAPDMLNFLEALLQGNEGFTKSIIEGAQKGWGWQLNQPWFMGVSCSRNTFGKTGFTGASCVVDIDRGIAFVTLSNRTCPKRPKDMDAINAFRSDIADIMFKSRIL